MRIRLAPLLLVLLANPGSIPSTLAAESEDAPAAAFDIVGVWRETHSRYTCDLEFARDGVFRGYLYPNAGKVWSFRGRWSLVGDRLYYTYTASSSAHMPEGTEDDDVILEVTAEYLRLRNRRGEIARYQRIEKLERPVTQESNW